MIRTITLGFVLIILAACASKTKTTGKYTDVGVWTGKVQMINKKTNYKKWAYVNWASDSKQDRMRIDVSAVFDVPIATFIKNGKTSELWLFTERTYYRSQDGRKLFKHLTKLSLDPDIFYTLLGTPKSPGDQWMCKTEDKVFECVSTLQETSFKVNHDSADNRIVDIQKTEKALRMRLSRSKVQVKNKLFKSLSTSQFKTIEI